MFSLVQRIEYKLCLLVHKALIGHTPDYITCSHWSPAFQHAHHCVPPAMVIFIYRERAANRGPCIFRGCTSCMESVTQRTQTDAVINNNF